MIGIAKMSATLEQRLDDVLRIGDGVGANRVGGTPEEDEACALAVGWFEEAGLEVEVDGRGNVVGRLHGRSPELPEVWTGSHLDSVPEGGRFDGALGVVAGLAAVEAIGQSDRTLGVVVFRDEETGCHGSRWRAANGALPGSYVELHIEQGPVLAEADAPLGVVSSIAGIVRCSRDFAGRADHAGTTPMAVRQDALTRRRSTCSRCATGLVRSTVRWQQWARSRSAPALRTSSRHRSG